MNTLPFKELELRLHTDFTEPDIRKTIEKKLRIKNFNYEILKQSLDARKKPNVYWLLRARVFSEELKGDIFRGGQKLEIPYKKRNVRAIVVGSGPAGFFAAYVLQQAGFRVTIIEKGPKVDQRANDIISFEAGGDYNNHSNYCHGEGGAGTFSDGKLTSRTKGISLEKQFVFESYVKAGAPAEIQYLAKPHIGSDKLKTIIPNLRRQFERSGGEIHFDTEVQGLEIRGKSCNGVITNNGHFPCDLLVVAPGHSSYQTYRMLNRNGIRFRSKPFAIGVRVEHPQELINRSQWSSPKLPGVKAAEYKLTYTASNRTPVYSFCMCPGGKVVPSAPTGKQNIVNGVSDYARNSPFANAAVVAGIDLGKVLEEGFSLEKSLRWLEGLERKVFHLTESYKVPGNRIEDFIMGKVSQKIPANSYPFDVFPFDFSDLLPPQIINSLREGLINFSRKVKGFETGIMLGLETKTSSPVQVIRDDHRRCEGFENIFVVGEGSGYSGGITSSAVDGVKVGMDILNLY